MIIYCTIYHGTKFEFLESILENGFDSSTRSCASNDIESASYYGKCVMEFKFPMIITFSNAIHFIFNHIFRKNLIIELWDFKPNFVRIHYL